MSANTAILVRNPVQAVATANRGSSHESVQGLRQTMWCTGTYIWFIFPILFQNQKIGVRNYSGGPPLSLDLVKSRVLLVLQLYDKVNPEKVATYMYFLKNLFISVTL